MDVLIILVFFIVAGFILYIVEKSAYYNGVNDGYGYSKEPECPGYKKAGKYLKKYHSHRWRELGD